MEVSEGNNCEEPVPEDEEPDYLRVIRVDSWATWAVASIDGGLVVVVVIQVVLKVVGQAALGGAANSAASFGGRAAAATAMEGGEEDSWEAEGGDVSPYDKVDDKSVFSAKDDEQIDIRENQPRNRLGQNKLKLYLVCFFKKFWLLNVLFANHPYLARLERMLVYSSACIILFALSSVLNNLNYIDGLFGIENPPYDIKLEALAFSIVGGFIAMRLFKTIAFFLMSSKRPKVIKIFGTIFVIACFLAAHAGLVYSMGHQSIKEFGTFWVIMAAVFALERHPARTGAHHVYDQRRN